TVRLRSSRTDRRSTVRRCAVALRFTASLRADSRRGYRGSAGGPLRRHPLVGAGRGVCDFFFFQAEDGIRDWSVTGVQTCALPICRSERTARLAREAGLELLASLTDVVEAAEVVLSIVPPDLAVSVAADLAGARLLDRKSVV